MAAPAEASHPEWSAWERDLWSHVTAHVDQEQALLDDYADIAASTGSKAFRYLVELLVEDEVRHHELLVGLADAVQAMADVRADDPAVPYLDFDRVDGGAVRAATRALLAREREDARELRRLRRALRGVEDTTLWALVVDLMRRDTAKHAAILRFVLAHAHETP